jgi:short-subunit dehydrogenase
LIELGSAGHGRLFMELRNRVGILTGASRGIGAHLAEGLARKGVNLALAARSEGDLKDIAGRLDQFGVKTAIVPTDVTRIDELQNLFTHTEQELGPVDLLVNNAGIERYAHFEDNDFEYIENTIRTNLVAAELLTRIVLPGMIDRGRGHVCNISSMAGKVGVPFNTVYSSTKHALVGFSLSLREEMRRYGVEVSVVCPGFVSGAGMFQDWSRGKKPPGLTSTVPIEKVTDKTVETIENNKAETVVAGGLLKVADIFQAISPQVIYAIGRKGGTYSFIEKEAVEAWREN